MRHTSKKRAARAQSDLPAETMGQIIQLSANCASATPAGECCCGDVIRTRLLHFFGDALTGGDAKSAILASRTFARPRHDQIAPASCRSPTQYLAGSYRHSGSCLPRARKQPLGSEVFAGAVRRLALATGLPDICGVQDVSSHASVQAICAERTVGRCFRIAVRAGRRHPFCPRWRCGLGWLRDRLWTDQGLGTKHRRQPPVRIEASLKLAFVISAKRMASLRHINI